MKKLLYKIFDRFTFNQIPYFNFFVEMEQKPLGELKNFQFTDCFLFHFNKKVKIWNLIESKSIKNFVK